MCTWRPLALCLQHQLYFEPCPASTAETSGCMYTTCFVKYPNQIALCFRIPIFKRVLNNLPIHKPISNKSV